MAEDPADIWDWHLETQTDGRVLCVRNRTRTDKPASFRIAISPGMRVPWELAHSGVCDNCCFEQDQSHCLSARPYTRRTFRFPERPYWQTLVLKPTSAYEPLQIVTLCAACIGRTTERTDGFPPDHANGFHALNSWLYDNYGQWAPPNTQRLPCAICNERHERAFFGVYPGDVTCLACYIKKERL